MVTIDGAKFAKKYGLEIDELRNCASSFAVDGNGNVVYKMPLRALMDIIVEKLHGRSYAWRE